MTEHDLKVQKAFRLSKETDLLLDALVERMNQIGYDTGDEFNHTQILEFAVSELAEKFLTEEKRSGIRKEALRWEWNRKMEIKNRKDDELRK